jgi:PBSX family phage terminase large subunit
MFGEQVYCLGAEKVNQVSKIRGASIKYCYCDELAEYNEEVWELLKSRLDKPYSCLDATLNPESNTHWLKINFLDTIEEKGIDCYIQSYTIFDNEFLDKTFVDNLCKEYEGTVYYNRYILGQWCNAEGIIFTPIANESKRYLTNDIIDGFVSIGIDWGGNGSKHSITASVISRDYSKIQVLASDLMVSTGTNTKQVFRWINEFIQKIIDKYDKRPQAIFCDSAEQVLNNSLRSELQFNIPIIDSIKTPIEERIKCIIRLLNSDRISFAKKDTNTIVTALQTVLYDESSQTDRWIDDGKTSDIDSLDSFVYSWEKWMKQLMIKKEI